MSNLIQYQTKIVNDYVLITDDSELKDFDWAVFGNPLNTRIGKVQWDGRLLKFCGLYYTLDETKKIIAHLPLNQAPILEGVDLLPPLEDDVEKLAREHSMATPDNDPVRILSYIKGYNKAKEKYKWTNEDVIRIVEKSRETGLTAEYLMLSYSQPKMPIGFERELANIMGKGEPIIERNPQGQTVWVGKWIY